MSTIDPKKIAFKGTTNTDLQKHINTYFTTLGGNPSGLGYTSPTFYYFIENSGKIIRASRLPTGYTEREPGDYFKDSLGGIKNERKFAFLGSKDPKINNKILDFFIKLGATKRQNLLGTNEVLHYFIDKTNTIDYSSNLPEGYILQLHTYLNVMKNQEDKIPEYVECIKPLLHSTVGKIYKVIDSRNCESDRLDYKYSWQENQFKPSTKEAYEAQNTYLKAADYVPQVGDYVVMERAGGWGYSPDNNGCLAIISQISNRVIEHIKGSSVTFSISGEVINPNKDRAVKFSSVPQFGYDKEVIFRKALPHEVPGSNVKTEPQQQFEASPTAAVSESPLEICKRKYKKGMLVRSAEEYGVFSGEFVIDVDPSEFYYTINGVASGVAYFASRGWLYLDGKFAEILEEPKENNPHVILEQNIRGSLERRTQYPITPENAFPVKALRKQLKIANFQSVHEIKTVEEKLLKKTKSKLFNI